MIKCPRWMKTKDRKEEGTALCVDVIHLFVLFPLSCWRHPSGMDSIDKPSIFCCWLHPSLTWKGKKEETTLPSDVIYPFLPCRYFSPSPIHPHNPKKENWCCHRHQLARFVRRKWRCRVGPLNRPRNSVPVLPRTCAHASSHVYFHRPSFVLFCFQASFISTTRRFY